LYWLFNSYTSRIVWNYVSCFGVYHLSQLGSEARISQNSDLQNTLYNTVGSWQQFRNNVEYAASIASCCQGPAQWLNEKLFALAPCRHKIPHRLNWGRCETPVCSSLRHTQNHWLRVPNSRKLFSLYALRLWETGMLNVLVWLLCYLIWNFPHLKV
jgi:hypothetical protein